MAPRVPRASLPHPERDRKSGDDGGSNPSGHYGIHRAPGVEPLSNDEEDNLDATARIGRAIDDAHGNAGDPNMNHEAAKRPTLTKVDQKQSMMHPDIKPAATGAGGHTIMLGG